MPEKIMVSRFERSNNLSAGSEGGANRWAIVASLVETAKLKGLERFAKLRDRPTTMAQGHQISCLDDGPTWSRHVAYSQLRKPSRLQALSRRSHSFKDYHKMDLDLAGRRVLVTGASQGIGEGIARAFGREGCNLVLVARDAERLDAVADRLRLQFKVSVDVLPSDLTDANTIDRLAACDGIDVLVNNAGSIPGGDLQTVGPEEWRRAWDLKVYGYIDLCRAFYTKMKRQGGGVILNNIGASAEYFDPRYIAGSSGNAALVAFTRALGARSLDDAIRVVGVNPGPVATDRIKRLLKERQNSSGPETSAAPSFPLGRPATVDEIADLFVFLASPRSAYTSGVVFTVDGGLSARHAP